MKFINDLLLSFLFAIALLMTACTGGGFEAKNKLSESQKQETPNVPQRPPSYDPTNLTKAIGAAAKTLVQRLPTTDESARAASGVAAYEAVIREYLAAPSFVTSMTTHHRNFFEMSGQSNGINYEEPTNIVVYIIKNNRDYREALTATYCVDNALVQTPFCNSFPNAAVAAEQAGGVVTTRGFLEKWQGPHNFRRVKHAFAAFACGEYPDGADVGMTVDEVSNVAKGSTANFSATTGSPVCYNCHRTINPRASLFLNFENSGIYLAPQARANLLAQLDNPNTPANMKSQIRLRVTTTEVADKEDRIEYLLKKSDGTIPTARYHEASVTKVRDYAVGFSKTSSFRKCTAQRFYNFMMGRDYRESLPSNLSYLESKLEGANFNINELIVEISKSYNFVNR